MYNFFFFFGIALLVMLFLWKKINAHHIHKISSVSGGNSSSKPAEEYRKLAKKFLREKRFQEAEECYAKAKEVEGN
jgi:hypothetical protein